MPIKSGVISIADGKAREVSPISVAINYILPLVLAAVVALYIGCVLSCRVVIEASINSTPVGYIESSSVLPKLKYEVENQLASELGSPYSLDCEFSYKLKLAREPKFLSESALTVMLLDIAHSDFVESYMLYIDGVQVGANADRDGIDSLIDEIEAGLLELGNDMTADSGTVTSSGTDTSSNANTSSGSDDEYSRVEILNRIHIKKQLCEKSSIKSLDEINALLNPIYTARAVTEPRGNDSESESTLRISAFSAMSAGYDTASELIDLDVDYGVTRGSSADTEDDVKLNYHFIRTETVEETVRYTTSYVDDYDSFIGTNTLAQQGSDGRRRVTYEISCDADGNEVARSEVASETLIPMVERIIMVGAAEIPDPVPTGTYIWPCEVNEGISSDYGGRDLYGSYDFHLGIDIPGTLGDEVWASDGGEVVWASYTPSYGNSIRIQHDDGYVTLYAHLDELLVEVGDSVYQGQLIGKMGHTGAAYGTHLHFEVRIGSSTVNPNKYLPEDYN